MNRRGVVSALAGANSKVRLYPVSETDDFAGSYWNEDLGMTYEIAADER